MGKVYEVTSRALAGAFLTNPVEFAGYVVDAMDAKIAGGAYEALTDIPKPILKQAIADVIGEKIHAPLDGITIECESD